MTIKIGIYNLHMHARGGGEKRTLVLAEHLSRSHEVWLFVNERPDPLALQRYFNVDLSRVKYVPFYKDRPQYRVPRGRPDTLATLFAHFRQIKKYKLQILINNSYGSNLPCPAERGIYMCMFPHDRPFPVRAGSFRGRIYHPLIDQTEKYLLDCRVSDAIDSYSAVTANSSFTAEWVEKKWRRQSEVVYSACDNMGPAAKKERIILNVGRFATDSTGGFHKRQDILFEVFSRLTNLRREGWQLHFAGSVARDTKSRELLVRLREASNGISVFFHLDADFGTLRDLYRRASLYWHATGFGLPASEHPHLQEHFGLTTIEAMSAGAVPVVINSGGQTEAVTHTVDGFLWNELSTLADQTTELINDHHLLQRISRQAMSSSTRFSRADFNARMDSIIDRLIVKGGDLRLDRRADIKILPR